MKRAKLFAVMTAVSLACCLWAGGPETQLSFPDIQGTVGIANGGTGQTASSSALAALGGFPSAGGTISGFTALGTGNTAIKCKVVYISTGASGAATYFAPHGLSLTGTNKIVGYTVLTYSTVGGIAVGENHTANPNYNQQFYVDSVNCVINLIDAGSLLTNSTATVTLFYKE